MLSFIFLSRPIRKKVATLFLTIQKLLSTKTHKTNETGKQTDVSKNDNINERMKSKKEFGEIFEPQGKLIGHDVKFVFKANAKITTKRQKSTFSATRRGHIERVTEVTDKEFIQPVFSP